MLRRRSLLILIAIVLLSPRIARAAWESPCPDVGKTRGHVRISTPTAPPLSYCDDNNQIVETSFNTVGFRCEDAALLANNCKLLPEDLETEIGWSKACDAPTGPSWDHCEDKNAPKPEAGTSCFDPQRDPSKQFGDPVDAATGVLKLTVTDLDLGGGLAFTRHYSSAFDFPQITAMGNRWRHSLGWSIRRDLLSNGDQIVNVVPPFEDGDIFVINEPGETEWEGAARSSGTLSGDFSGELTYTTDQGVAYVFDIDDDLVRIEHPGEEPIVVSDPGTIQTFTRGADVLAIHRPAGFVASVTGGGDTISYQHTGDHLVEAVQPNPDGSGNVTWAYGYEDLNGNAYLESVTRNGQPHSSWDIVGGLVRSADEPALDQELFFEYSGPTPEGLNQTAIRQDHPVEGAVLATLLFDPDTGALRSATGTGGPGVEIPFSDGQLDSSDRWHSRTDQKGYGTVYEDYDDRGRPRRIVEGWLDANSNGTWEPGEVERVTRYTWHPRLDAPLRIERESSIPDAPGDAVTIFDYDADGSGGYNDDPTDLLRARIEDGFTLDASGAAVAFASPITTTFTYTAEGRLEEVDGPGAQNLTKHGYDAAGNREWTRRYVDGSIYLQTTFSIFDGLGNPRFVTDPNQRVTEFEYDGVGRVVMVDPPGGGPGDRIGFDYDLDGRVEEIQFPGAYTLTLEYSADGKGNLEVIRDSEGEAIVYEYGTGKSRRTRAMLYSDYGGTGETLVGDSEFSYDQAGRLLNAFNPLFGDKSVFTTFGHDDNGNTDSVVDENGKADTLLYDALDRLEEVQQVRSGGTFTTVFDYDAGSNVSRVTDVAGKQTEYVTDDLGRLVKVASPDTGTTLYLYDEAGNLASKIDDHGGSAQRTTGYIYDGLDRVVAIDYPNDPDWTFTYDTDLAKNQMGRLARVENTGAIVANEFEYTDRGQLALEATEIDGVRYEVTYTYDAAGNVETVTSPSGMTTTYTYTGSRVSEVEASVGIHSATVTGLQWLPFGPLTQARFTPADGQGANQVVLTRDYNLRYQQTELDVTGPQGVILDRSYTYDHTTGGTEPDDPGPNLDRLVDHLDATESRFYVYDELDRLEKATDLTGTALFTYGYDAAGNRVLQDNAAGLTQYTYEPGSDRLEGSTGAVTRHYAHDANGNRIWDAPTPYTGGTPTYEYNEAGRLVTARNADLPQVLVHYTYDAFGRLVKREGTSAFAGPRLVFWDQSGRVLEGIVDQTEGEMTITYLWAEGELLGRADRIATVGTPIGSWVPGWLAPDPEGWLGFAARGGSRRGPRASPSPAPAPAALGRGRDRGPGAGLGPGLPALGDPGLPVAAHGPARDAAGGHPGHGRRGGGPRLLRAVRRGGDRPEPGRGFHPGGDVPPLPGPAGR